MCFSLASNTNDPKTLLGTRMHHGFKHRGLSGDRRGMRLGGGGGGACVQLLLLSQRSFRDLRNPDPLP